MNKTALVTGASSGLGKDFATLFAEKGYDLVLTARRRKNLEEISSNLTNQFGIKVSFISCDLSDLKSTEEIYNFCEESKIQIDVWVNIGSNFEEILHFQMCFGGNSMFRIDFYLQNQTPI